MTRFRLTIALVVALAAVAVALSLGNWQLNRAQQKLALQEAWDRAARQPPLTVTGANAAAVVERLPRRVRMTGRFTHEHEVWLDNRQMDGQVGFFLITPLRLSDGAVVPVNRGFATRDPRDRTRLPPVDRPDAEVTVEGLAIEQPPRVLQLGDEAAATMPQPVIWQNFDFERFERLSGAAVTRWVVQQAGEGNDGLLRRWPRMSAGVDVHRGYAFQWFALAALIAGLTGFFGYRALRRHREAKDAKR